MRAPTDGCLALLGDPNAQSPRTLNNALRLPSAPRCSLSAKLSEAPVPPPRRGFPFSKLCRTTARPRRVSPGSMPTFTPHSLPHGRSRHVSAPSGLPRHSVFSAPASWSGLFYVRNEKPRRPGGTNAGAREHRGLAESGALRFPRYHSVRETRHSRPYRQQPVARCSQ